MLISVHGGMHQMLPCFILKIIYHLGKFIHMGEVETQLWKGFIREAWFIFIIVSAGMLLIQCSSITLVSVHVNTFFKKLLKNLIRSVYVYWYYLVFWGQFLLWYLIGLVVWFGRTKKRIFRYTTDHRTSVFLQWRLFIWIIERMILLL